MTVDGYSVPTGSTEFDYLDVFFSASLGSLDVDETPFDLRRRRDEDIEGTVARTTPETGRELFGKLRGRARAVRFSAGRRS